MTALADTIIAAPMIHTFDPERPLAEAVAIANGKILAVGAIAELESLRCASTRLLTFDGAITPGLTDSHTHIVMGTSWTRGADLTDLSLAEVREVLSAEVRDLAAGQWVRGWGLDPNVFPDGFDGRIFDDVTGAHPMFLRMRDGHSAICNTLALKLAGITGAETFRDESAVGVDADGAPTGYLLEFSAMDLVLVHGPIETVSELGERLLQTLTAMAATGLTATHVLDFEAPSAEVIAWVEEHYELPLRVRFSPLVFPGTTREDWEEVLAQQGTGGRRWVVDGVKFMIDGTVDNGSAWLGHPDIFGQGTKSIWTDTNDYRQALRFFAEHSVSTATHAIGDRGVEFVLDSIEALGELGRRSCHRIEHIETIPDETVARFAQLGVAASMQPIHGTHHTRADRSDNWSVRLGEERAGRGWRCQDLRAQGATLALGSDWPITPFDPREMMADSILRRPVRQPQVAPVQPEQALTTVQAFEGYTLHSARSAGLEDSAGSIAPGKHADLTVFAVDPFELSAEELADVEIAACFVAGSQTF